MPNKEFKLRREQLLKQLGEGGAAIVFAAKEVLRSGKENYPYRQNSDFYYLTGFVEPEAVAVLIPGRREGAFVLFSRGSDPAKEVWHSPVIGQEKSQSEYGADQAFTMAEIDNILPKLLASCDQIYFNFSADLNNDLNSKIISWLNQVHPQVTSGSATPYKLLDLGKILHEMRFKKTQFELAIIRKAVAITAKGHLKAMQKCKPGMYEYELEAEMIYEFNRSGGSSEAFATIVAGGANACTLHYSKNNSELRDGELVLVDAGAEYKYYCADVARTFPINGKFSTEQRTIYEIVLAAQTEVIKQIRPGVRWDQLQLTAELIITQGLIDAGLLQGETEALHAKQAFMSFFMHKIGHWLGIDVHDVGEYCINKEWRTLESGMVFTVEPGIYISPKIVGFNEKWLGIGVRIEDNILVTDSGYEVLSDNVPKNVSDLEEILKNRI